MWSKIRQRIEIALLAALTAFITTLIYGRPSVPPPAPAPTPPSGSTPAPPPPRPVPPPHERVYRIIIGSSGCSSGIVLPPDASGQQYGVTAAHCVPTGRSEGVLLTRSGSRVRLTILATDRASDAAVFMVHSNEPLPFLDLADDVPPPGTAVWHAGWGVDHPGNVETGTVVEPLTSNNQTRFRLSVSSGDSGGVICRADNNQVISVVCCTTAPGRTADVWGASVRSLRALLRRVSTAEDWTPLEIPIRQ